MIRQAYITCSSHDPTDPAGHVHFEVSRVYVKGVHGTFVSRTSAIISAILGTVATTLLRYSYSRVGFFLLNAIKLDRQLVSFQTCLGLGSFFRNSLSPLPITRSEGTIQSRGQFVAAYKIPNEPKIRSCLNYHATNETVSPRDTFSQVFDTAYGVAPSPRLHVMLT